MEANLNKLATVEGNVECKIVNVECKRYFHCVVGYCSEMDYDFITAENKSLFKKARGNDHIGKPVPSCRRQEASLHSGTVSNS